MMHAGSIFKCLQYSGGDKNKCWYLCHLASLFYKDGQPAITNEKENIPLTSSFPQPKTLLRNVTGRS